MISIDININLLLIPVIVFLSALLGFAFRAWQVNGLRRKVLDLENEMLTNHAEILTLERRLAFSQSAKDESGASVVSIKDTSSGEKNAAKKYM